MSYKQTFCVSYDSTESVTLSVKQSEHSVIETTMSFDEWKQFVEQPIENNKHMSIKIPLTETVNQYIMVPSRDFRQMVSEYKLMDLEE